MSKTMLFPLEESEDAHELQLRHVRVVDKMADCKDASVRKLSRFYCGLIQYCISSSRYIHVHR